MCIVLPLPYAPPPPSLLSPPTPSVLLQAGRFGRDTPSYYGTAVSSGFAVSYRNRYLPQYRTAVARASAQAAVINTGFAGQSLAAAAAEAYTSNRLAFAQSQVRGFTHNTCGVGLTCMLSSAGVLFQHCLDAPPPTVSDVWARTRSPCMWYISL